MRHEINRIVLFVTLCCISATAVSGQRLADSLNTVLSKKDLSIEERVLTLGQLERVQMTTHVEQALETGQQALLLSRTLKDAQYTSYAYGMLFLVHYYNNKDIINAQLAVDSAIWYAEKSGNRRIKGFALYRKAILNNIQGNVKETISNSLTALKLLEGTQDHNWKAHLYYILTGNYADQGELSLQQKYVGLLMQEAKRSPDFDNLINAYQAAGTAHHYAYLKNKDQKLLDSALYYNKKAISLSEAFKSRMVFQSTIAILALNTADLYKQHFPENYKDTIIRYIRLALETGKSTGQLGVVGGCYGMLSDYAMEEGNYKKAEELLQQGLAVIMTDTVKNLNIKTQIMKSLSAIAEKRGDLRAALNYEKQYNMLYTQQYDEQKNSISKKLEAQFEAGKKEEALIALRNTATLNKRMGYLYIGLAIASVIAGLFIFWSLKLRLKETSLLAQQELAQEKSRAEMNARLQEEETMRLIAEQQLLQERQDRLQRDLLAGSLKVEEKDELLQTLQRKIEETNHDSPVFKQINRIIDNNKKTDDEYASNKADFDNIHPEFFERLKEKSSNTLSRLDLKHCTYISIGLTNKEIAQRLNIAPKSILMARYRIKLKLGLGKETDLDEFIAKVLTNNQ